jgi:hypothetical protein
VLLGNRSHAGFRREPLVPRFTVLRGGRARYEPSPRESSRCAEALLQRRCSLQITRNQVEIYFSVLQRKALTPSDFASLGELEERLLGFGERYEQVANPFEWKFTRRDLRRLLRKLRERERPLAAAA